MPFPRLPWGALQNLTLWIRRPCLFQGKGGGDGHSLTCTSGTRTLILIVMRSIPFRFPMKTTPFRIMLSIMNVSFAFFNLEYGFLPYSK